ncbi:restriction endonuclease subunit S [Bacteroides thetaiotaomicron]|uniref:restriction endonuclease subunit S n=2 Tax=Bacteroides TaxID=816 RepID=UPI0021665FDB|nr:restriction endonuclease subunit S [Bacteroides thetaiotaomicron]MCS3329555.1 restriction endonuclease subunit S [Bacteroides thetaiotaomicron]
MSRVKFGDVVKDVKINIDRLNNPYEYYVAGDHMDSEDLTIHRKGCFTTDDVGPAFIRVFKPGQILYGSRRTYLKKIAVADFEGVCANTTFVFETKDPHAFEQRLLPFIMLSKDFTTWSIAKSKGSTNPYVLFSDLADFEFELPPLEEQKVLVDKLWAAYRLKEAYKKLLVATDEMVKSQFIEIFYGMETTPVKDYIDDSFPGEWGTEDKDGNGVKVIRTTNFTNSGKLNLADVVTRSIEDRKVVRKQIKKYDTILERSGGTADNPVGRVVLFEEDNLFLCNNFTQVLRFKDVDPRFAFYALYYFYQTNRTAIRSMGSKTTGIQNLNMSKYLEIGIPNASDEDQKAFVTIAEQADKSKFGDFKSQFIEMFGNPVTNTKGWKTAKIKDVAPEMPSKEQLSGKIWLLNLDMIESNTGRIIEKVYEDVENALSVQSFDEGNVLFSKLRPYLNKVVIPDEPGMATTELVPLRPEPSKLHKVFLSHLLRGNQFVNYANDIAGGTKMPRMPLTELRNFDCILPPMDKQLEFVFIAEQVDKSKSVIQKALVYLNDIQSDELGKIA